jgi:cysteine desulfurase
LLFLKLHFNFMQNNSSVFLDYASTTPVDKRVVDVMLPYFNQEFGNSSSIHKYGQRAENALETSRHKVAEILQAHPNEVIFTSCGSESDNLALRGVAIAERNQRAAQHILISAVEHQAILNTAYQLRDLHDFEVEVIPVDKSGMVDPQKISSLIRPDTAIVSVIYANNEIGTINLIAEIGAICRERGVPFHTDAVQAAAHLPVDVTLLNVDLLSLGGHKFYGPKGVGALYVRQGTPIVPVLTGGGQENNLRAGTHNIPYIVGFTEAFSLAQEHRAAREENYLKMRDQLINTILDSIPQAKLTGHPDKRLPNHTSFVFEGVDGNTLLMMLDMAGFACSSGSACKTGDPEPSEVLLALGFPRNWALGSLRVTLGQQTSFREIEDFLGILPDLVQQVRELQN